MSFRLLKAPWSLLKVQSTRDQERAPLRVAGSPALLPQSVYPLGRVLVGLSLQRVRPHLPNLQVLHRLRKVHLPPHKLRHQAPQAMPRSGLRPDGVEVE